jgi:hypothetical protein
MKTKIRMFKTLKPFKMEQTKRKTKIWDRLAPRCVRIWLAGGLSQHKFEKKLTLDMAQETSKRPNNI